MEHVTRDLQSQNSERITPKPDRSEVVKAMHENGGAEGFSLEWVVDHFPQQFAEQR